MKHRRESLKGTSCRPLADSRHLSCVASGLNEVSGSPFDQFERALDSTAGFNQVIVALKALIEHDAQINVVDDHG